MGISVGSEFFLSRIFSIALSFGLLFILILIGVLFDVIGIAATAATEKPFHAKAAKKVTGAVQALWLVRNADRVANFCNDVVGDICAAASGAVGATIALRLTQFFGTETFFWGIVMTGFVAAFTVGGKAFGKSLAIRRCHEIIFLVAGWVAQVETILGWQLFQIKRNKVTEPKNGASGKPSRG